MMVKRISRTFMSLRFTIILIICFIVIFLLGVIIPQKGMLGGEAYNTWKSARPTLVSFLDLLGLTDIYVAPLTLVLWGIFFLNLLAVMVSRIKPVWSRCIGMDIPKDKEAISAAKICATVGGDRLQAVHKALRKRGYEVSAEGDAFHAVKNRFSPLATILFHLSFIVMLIGGTTSFYTKFRAEANVAVGETFTGAYQWVSTPKVGGIPRTTFTIEEIVPVYYKRDYPVDLRVKVRSERGTEEIGINRPFKEGALSFVITTIDVAPLFVLYDSTGREMDGAFVKLNVRDGKTDSFSMAEYEFKTKLYTDYSGKPEQKSGEKANLPQALRREQAGETGPRQPRQIINPAFSIEVIKDEESIIKRTIKQGEFIEFDAYRLRFEDLTYWANFYVGKEHGLVILYAGFMLVIVALIIRFLRLRRDIRGLLEADCLYLVGRGEFFPVMFEDEFSRIIKDVSRGE